LVGILDHQSAIEFISKLDILVMTPRWEGLPLLPLEAMFMKVPVVSTAVGGIPEVIEHGETGMLSQSENADELAAHVSALLNDGQLRQSVVEKAFNRVHAKFSQNAMLAQIRESYHRTCRSSIASGTAHVCSHAPQQTVV
jgi:glycosyltransferase involved in cell wall biosynthesis